MIKNALVIIHGNVSNLKVFNLGIVFESWKLQNCPHKKWVKVNIGVHNENRMPSILFYSNPGCIKLSAFSLWNIQRFQSPAFMNWQLGFWLYSELLIRWFTTITDYITLIHLFLLAAMNRWDRQRDVKRIRAHRV